MKIFDAAEQPGGPLMPLLELGIIALYEKVPDGKLQPVAVLTGAKRFKFGCGLCIVSGCGGIGLRASQSGPANPKAGQGQGHRSRFGSNLVASFHGDSG